MLSILKQENGNLSIVMLMAVIGMVSGLSMSSLVLRDFRNLTYEFENVQARHLLRSDAYRGQNFLVSNPLTIGEVFVLPERRFSLNSGDFARSFKLRSYVEKTRENTLIGSDTGIVGTDNMDVFRLNTMVSTAVGSSFNTFDSNSTRVVIGSSLTLNQSSFAEFMYFTDQDTSPAGKNVYFYGSDVIEGKVHSNSDIQIKNVGGWPTFLNLVTTTGHIVSHSGEYDEEEVFQGGLIEEYDGYIFPKEATTLRNNARHNLMAGSTGPENTIYLVRVNKGQSTFWRGDLSVPIRKSATVWDPYPSIPLDAADSLFTNSFTIRDTIWTSGTLGQLSGNGIWVDANLWLEGTFSGNQTWGCSQNIYLVGDILLDMTPLGESPVYNPKDMVGIVSEKSILIKYGYKDPDSLARVHPNCGADDDYTAPAGGGIFIYAAMCALGDGGDTSATDPNFKHGVFTFEYQHPHGSTPAINGEDDNGDTYFFDWIDLHRYRYPPTSSDPWPIANPSLDYPWYNPLWPEARPYLERGTINVYGAIAQRRRGFVHRSGNDSEYPSNDGYWDIEMDMCGGPVTPPVPYNDPVIQNLVLLPRNWPGASGSGVGYKYKNYNFDYRFLNTQPVFYPEAQLTGGKKPLAHGSWSIVIPDRPKFNRYF